MNWLLWLLSMKAGIKDDKPHAVAKEILLEIGELFQIQVVFYCSQINIHFLLIHFKLYCRMTLSTAMVIQ